MRRYSRRMESQGRMLYNEDGAVTALVALMLVVLMGFGALAVDVGSLYKARREMVTAADAAALAGARELALSGGVNTLGALAAAENYAIARNGAGSASVNIVNIGTDQAIEVIAMRNENLYLAKALGFMNKNVTARAVATWGFPTEMIGGNLYPLIIEESMYNAGVKDLHLKLEDYGGNWGLLDIGSGLDSVNEALRGFPVDLDETFTVGEIIEALTKPGDGGQSIIKAIEDNAPKPEKDGRMVRAAEGLIGMTGWVPIFTTEDHGGTMDIVIKGFAAYEIKDVIVNNQGEGSVNAFLAGAPIDYGTKDNFPMGMIIGRFIPGQVVDADISSISQDTSNDYGMFKVKLVE